MGWCTSLYPPHSSAHNRDFPLILHLSPSILLRVFCLTLYQLFKTILDLQLYLMHWLKEFFLLSKYSLYRASYLLERKLFSHKSKGFQKIHFYRHISFQNHCVLVFNLISLHDAGEIFIMLNSAVNKNRMKRFSDRSLINFFRQTFQSLGYMYLRSFFFFQLLYCKYSINLIFWFAWIVFCCVILVSVILFPLILCTHNSTLFHLLSSQKTSTGGKRLEGEKLVLAQKNQL